MLFQGWGGLFIPLTGGFLIISAKAEQMAANVESRLAGVTVDDVTWYGVAEATADTDAETMLGQRGRLGAPRVVAVQDGHGGLTGLVAEEQLWMVPEQQRPFTRLAQLMIPFNRIARAEPHEALAPVLGRLNPQTSFITVWRDGRLVGIVTQEALQRRLQKVAALHRGAVGCLADGTAMPPRYGPRALGTAARNRLRKTKQGWCRPPDGTSPVGAARRTGASPGWYG